LIFNVKTSIYEIIFFLSYSNINFSFLEYKTKNKFKIILFYEEIITIKYALICFSVTLVTL